MGKHGYVGATTPRRLWWRRAAVGTALFLTLLIVFHRPILSVLVRQVARHYAAKENLNIDFWLEGNVLTNLSVRNLHISPTGPTDIESIDAELVRVDYSLFGFLRHGRAGLLKNLQVWSARIALNPAKRPRLPPGVRARKKSAGLPTTLFPDRLRLSDVSLVVRDKPHDFFLQHVDVELDPSVPGKLQIDRMQLTNGQSWTKISGATSYASKNLVIRDVILNDQDRIDLLNLDASAIDSKKLELKLKAKVGSGKVAGSMQWIKQRSTVWRSIHLHLENVSADALNKYIDLPERLLRGQVEKLDVDLTGSLISPSSWNGVVNATLRNFYIGPIGFNSWIFSAWVKDGQAALESADLVQKENHIYLNGSARLPDRIEDLRRSVATVDIVGAAVDLGKLTSELPEPLTGSAQINGKIELSNGKAEGNFLASAGKVVFKDGTIEKALSTIHASKILPERYSEKPWFAGLQTTGQIEMSNIRYRACIFDSLKASVKSGDDLVTFEHLNLRRNQNDLSLHGHYHLPPDIDDFAATTADIAGVLKAPQLGDFWAADSKEKISGPMEMTGQIQWKEQKASGGVSLFGANLQMRGLAFQQLGLQGTIANNVVYVNDLTARLKEPGFVNATGIIDLRPPLHYSGKLAANVPNLAALEPWLRASGNKKELSGSLKIDWEGSGEPHTLKNLGKLKLVMEHARYGDLQKLQANIDATYTRDALEVPIFFLATDKMNFETIVQSKEETLEVTKIALNQGEAKYATGYISIPFVWKNIWKNAPVVPSSGKVVASFQSENIDIAKLFKDLGGASPVTGVFTVKLDAGGTVEDLNARLDMQIRDLRSAQTPKLEPAIFDLTAQVEHDQLTVAGKLQQRQIQPLELSGKMPFDIPRIVRQLKIPDDTPITGKIHQPRSSVNLLRQLLPEVEIVDGDLALDVDVKGKFGQPMLNGNADMTVNLLRFKNATLPALRDFKARLVFSNDNLKLEHFAGELAGGRFTTTGGVNFPTIASANLDLHLKADSVLVARNDTMTMRADADLSVVGPVTSANVSGNLAITNSRFLKNIDLIPIGLPGRPAPQPPSSQPDFSIPQLPFRDWKFNVAIKTKDPVLLRGNLATGDATCELQLTGTGLAPGLSGVLRLRNVDATLPFSRMSISYGFLYFDPSDSLNPKIDLNGTSVIQDYTVHVYVYGTVLSPQAIFTSEPPLPQEEIISLLATGTTRDQLTGNNNALAGRAAMLLVQQVYRKVFKKGEQMESNNVFDRLDLDVGQIDQRTGQRQATARYRINKQFMVIGDVEVGGDFRVKLRYLIRFR
ncbi:MAG: translocation/assembly module TamB domain-containing protein [Verrucomicrobiota bacterium]